MNGTRDERTLILRTPTSIRFSKDIIQSNPTPKKAELYSYCSLLRTRDMQKCLYSILETYNDVTDVAKLTFVLFHLLKFDVPVLWVITQAKLNNIFHSVTCYYSCDRRYFDIIIPDRLLQLLVQIEPKLQFCITCICLGSEQETISCDKGGTFFIE